MKQLFNTQQAAIPCPLEACDPRLPYALDGGVVTFVTAEADQSGPNGANTPPRDGLGVEQTVLTCDSPCFRLDPSSELRIETVERATHAAADEFGPLSVV